MASAPNDSCVGRHDRLSIFYGVPYCFFPQDPTTGPNPLTGQRDDPIQFWVHFGLVIFCFLLAIAVLIFNIVKTVPYGKYNKGDNTIQVPLRLAFGIMHILTGIVVFTITYFVQRNFDGNRLNIDTRVNIVMYCLFTIHYINRGIVDTIANRHSQRKVALWIPVLGTLTIMFYHFINAQFIGEAQYLRGYYYDPRFIIGIILFITGFILNRVADGQLICLRTDYKDTQYLIPDGCSFHCISCPNYLGELIEWFGWVIMTWSLAGLVWFLFVAAILIPRARQNHKWYQKELDGYPPKRNALLPLVY